MNPRTVGAAGELRAGAGAAVMAAGIISVGLHLIGDETPSLVALSVSAAWWVLLGASFALRLFRDRPGWIAEAGTPPALTGVAATAVLGTRVSLLGRQNWAAALLALAVLLWPGLQANVMRHLRHGMPGGVFLVAVPAQSIAVLGGRLSLAYRADWLAWGALAFFLLGLVLYGVALTCFDVRRLLTGAGDQWVAGGALAIAALSGSTLLASPLWTGDAHRALRDASLALLVLTFAWYAVLLCAELYRPRPAYDLRRWSTVFPLGMIAATSLSLSATAGIGWLEPLGRVLLWLAVAAWLLVFAALLTTRLRSRPQR